MHGQVVLQHYRKNGEVKLVQLLYDDLLTWNEWVLETRTLQPAGLVSVGSDVVNTAPHDGHSKQAAIWETGMDNSPMYDQVTWNASVDKMLIYDVSRILLLLPLPSLLYLRVPARVQNGGTDWYDWRIPGGNRSTG